MKAPDEDSGSYSQVTIQGRLGARVEQRELPSGDAVTVFTVVVDRPPRDVGRGGVKSATVDAISCQTFRPVIARKVAAMEPGQWVTVEGTLRRRFWRTSVGLASVMEVDVLKMERVRVRT